MVGELIVRVLAVHPEVEFTVLGSDHAPGQNIADVCQGLKGVISHELLQPETELLASECDVVFFAKKTPDSMQIVPRLVEAGVKSIDIGGEFRFKDPAVYEKWYKHEHLCPGLLADAVYGLTELHRDEIKSAEVIGNPGCYATCAILPIAPLVAKGLVEPEGIIVDAFSGLTGAGRTPQSDNRNLFVYCNENVRAYGVDRHKHVPELELELARQAGGDVSVAFVPHVVPVHRGIQANIFATLKGSPSQDDLLGVYREFYAGEPFVRIYDDVSSVDLLNVCHTNCCDIGVTVARSGRQAIVISALDNMLKGAVGQAVQNMNLMFGVDETTALKGRDI